MAKKTVQKYKESEDCTHHWIIKPASGGDSQGKCKKCKIVQDFSNSGWNYSKTSWGHPPPTKKIQ